MILKYIEIDLFKLLFKSTNLNLYHLKYEPVSNELPPMQVASFVQPWQVSAPFVL